MTKRLCLSLALAIVAILLVIVPVLAVCYAYIYVEESDGNSYEELPLICPCNITTLVEGGFISSTGLDTRVLTGDGVTLPHMLTEDKIMFVSDLAAYEDKTLIFYLGATSLSSFPIIVGYNGTFETPDDPDLELGYVMELLISGYFDASGGVDQNILYKEDAFKVWISAEDTVTVATYNSTGDMQWDLEYDEFDSGTHILYVVANGLGAYLYVDDFDVAKDTENLFESNNAWIESSSGADPRARRTFYAHDKYWAFYGSLKYKTSADGLSWSGEQSINMTGTYSYSGTFGLWYRDGYVHILSGAVNSGTGYYGVIYRKGEPQADSSIVWSADWQSVRFNSQTEAINLAAIAVTDDGRPFAVYEEKYGSLPNWKWQNHVISSSATNGTWSTVDDFETHSSYVSSPSSSRGASICAFPNSNEIYVVYSARTDTALHGRYYNGISWSGSLDRFAPYNFVQSGPCVADSDGNVYVVQGGAGTSPIRLWIRFAGGTISDVIEVATGSSGYSRASIAYNEDANTIYITYIKDEYIKAVALNLNTWELSGEYPLFTTVGISKQTITAEGSHIGILYTASGPPSGAYHGFLEFPWDWNDNDNDWEWMKNNVMSYADYIILGVDGDVELTYQPDSIIQGTTLPDEENDHDGAITWGSNPSGVDVSHSELMCEEDEEGAGYYYFEPGSQDIIKPEPETMTGDVDLERLQDNPLYPLVQILAIPGFLTERLAWLGIAWFIVVVAMLGVHLGFDTRKNTEKPQHFVLTSATGLGLSIIFYTMGIFDWWVLLLMGLFLGGAIVWERQPVI